LLRAVVFDLWNTLVHSPGGNPFQKVEAFLTPEQRVHFAALQRDGMTRPYASARDFAARWRERLGLDAEQEEAFIRTFSLAEGEAILYPEALEVLERTRALGRIALLSNTQSFELDFLEALGLAAHFRVKGLSAELGHLKPEAGAFEALQRRLGLFPGELALVGDSWKDDVEGALRAGWTAIWINRRGRPRPDHDPDAELVELPDLVQVPDVVARLQAGARCSTCLG
jgi:putative hydrolase of the HAD superfamily